MPKRNDFRLTDEELDEIERAINGSKDVRLVKRATGLRLLHYGHDSATVAEMLMVALSTVYGWHERWKQNGLAGLQDRSKRGRPPVADAEYCQLLEEALSQEPEAYGYPFAIWTLGRLRAHLAERTGKTLSSERFRALMAKLGYVYRRPKRDLSRLQDKTAHAQAEALLEELKKGQGKTILSSSLWTKRP
jgi:transposase